MKIATRQWLKREMGMMCGVCFFLLVFMLALPGSAPGSGKVSHQTHQFRYRLSRGGDDGYLRPAAGERRLARSWGSRSWW